MTPFALLAIEIGMSFAILAVLSATVVVPRLAALPREYGLVPLLWVHALRHAPLALLAPGQSGAGVSHAVASTIAWGDFASGAFALAALVALSAAGARALGWVWAFSIVSSIDIVVALTLGLGSGVYREPLGPGWYVLTLYVPLVCVSQVLIVWLLVRRAPRVSRT